ncbi:MAG TPA: hypothetical protein PK847_14795 [Candidatus Sumerlaeota bacterium]|nr:hypothetical protein [Candidatus Sumerlaeota bacterium]
MFKRLILMILCATLPVMAAGQTLVHTSEFNANDIYGDPVAAGDATQVWARNGTFQGGSESWYAYNNPDELQFWHSKNHWDDPWLEWDTAPDVAAGGSLEVQLDARPAFTATGRRQRIQLLISTAADLAAPTGVPAAQATLTVENVDNVAQAYFQASGVGGAPVALGIAATDIISMRMFITYDQATTSFKGYLKLNDGFIRQIGQPVVAARTATVAHFRQNVTFADPANPDPFDVFLQELRVYDGIVTTQGDPIPVGTLLREASYNAEPNGDFFQPIGEKDADQLYMPDPTEHGYTGEGTFFVTKGPENNVYPNMSINTVTGVNEPAEWVIDVEPRMTADGIGQHFNVKLGDGNVYMGNEEGRGEGWGFLFGELNDPFNPDPANVQLVPTPITQVQKLRLIINYDADTQTWRFFWRVNDGPLREHPSSPLSAPRTATKVEFQYQVWNSDNSNPSPFTIYHDHYAEYYGVVTTEADPLPPNAARHWAIY